MRTITVKETLIIQKEILQQKIYLSDLEEFKNNDLTHLYNTVFNKSVTGIGGTTLALRSEENSIILMPFISVVDNKEGVVENALTVKGGVTIPTIVKYLKNNIKRKIISTYDGFEKIIKAYDKANINIYEDFLLIDEWQILFQQYGLRTDVIKFLLAESVKFDKKCFMTATPIKKKYWFKELLDLEELVLQYDIEPIILRHYKSKNIIDETIAIIRNQSKEKNLHFFINSVDTIKAITSTMKLPREEVRIICSAQEKNRAKLRGYNIEGTKDPVKKINFYTSTCFEGCDIFDENGRIFVLCDGGKAHTLVDVATTLPQIAGRIRDIKDTSVNLIYSSTRYIDVTQEEFDKAVEKNMESANKIINGIVDDEVYTLLADSQEIDMRLNSKYLLLKDNKLIYEEIFLHIDRANFEMAKDYSYKANITAKMPNGFNPIKVNKPWAKEIEIVKSEKTNSLSFKEQCQKYNELKQGGIMFIPDFSKVVIEAVNKLGIDRLEELNFHKGNISKALIGMLNISDEIKISQMLNLRKLKFYSSAQLKEKFRDIYNRLNIISTPKATDINNFYEVKSTTMRINGKATKGFIIMMPKINLK